MQTCEGLHAGALCPGGSLGQATPLLNQQGYWRSSPQSSQLYRCVQPSQCRGTPSHPGNETGEAACNPGATGPLCAVCKPGTFAFGGMCKCVPCWSGWHSMDFQRFSIAEMTGHWAVWHEFSSRQDRAQ